MLPSLPKINQFLPSISYGDAISNDAFFLQEILRSAGYESHIYAQNIHPKLADTVIPYTKYKGDPDNILIYHLSIGSDVAEYIRYLPDRRIIIYHNITPSHFFDKYHTELPRLLRLGRQELRMLIPDTVLALGDSAYNAAELKEIGYRRTNVLPIMVDIKKFNGTNAHLEAQYRDDYTNFLFVGRVVPNKGHMDLIKAFYVYKKTIDPKSRLFIVGSSSGLETYQRELEQAVATLKLTDVHFTGMINLRSLATYYSLAHVFISMSDHEGFLVPLVECMHFKVPILAYSSTAVSDTLGSSGIQFYEKDFEVVAQLMHRLAHDQALRAQVIESQNKELKRFQPKRIRTTFLKYIETLPQKA